MLFHALAFNVNIRAKGLQSFLESIFTGFKWAPSMGFEDLRCDAWRAYNYSRWCQNHGEVCFISYSSCTDTSGTCELWRVSTWGRLTRCVVMRSFMSGALTSISGVNAETQDPDDGDVHHDDTLSTTLDLLPKTKVRFKPAWTTRVRLAFSHLHKQRENLSVRTDLTFSHFYVWNTRSFAREKQKHAL